MGLAPHCLAWKQDKPVPQTDRRALQKETEFALSVCKSKWPNPTLYLQLEGFQPESSESNMTNDERNLRLKRYPNERSWPELKLLESLGYESYGSRLWNTPRPTFLTRLYFKIPFIVGGQGSPGLCKKVVGCNFLRCLRWSRVQGLWLKVFVEQTEPLYTDLYPTKTKPRNQSNHANHPNQPGIPTILTMLKHISAHPNGPVIFGPGQAWVCLQIYQAPKNMEKLNRFWAGLLFFPGFFFL